MIRDFTDETMEKMLSQIESVTPSGIGESVADFFSDIGSKFDSWFGDLKIKNYTDDLDTYHEKIFDMKDTSEKRLKEIFDNVYSVEEAYDKKFEDYDDNIINQKTTIDTLAKLLEPRNEASLARGRGVRALNGDELAALVDSYSFAHPEEMRRINEFFDTAEPPIEDLFKNRIIYMIMSAEEPYKTIYLNHIEYIGIGGTEGVYPDNSTYSVANFWAKYGDIFFTVGEFNTMYTDTRGPYNTFFHECGHAIDEYADGISDYNTISGDITFTAEELGLDPEIYGNKITMQSLVELDVYNNLEKRINEAYKYTTNKDNIDPQKVLDSLMNPKTSYELTEEEEKLKALVVQDFRNENNDGLHVCPSDVYGGVTNLQVVGSYGHRPGSGTSIDDYTYWYKDGEATGAQRSEFFAEYFSALMTGDYEQVEIIREAFPEATKAMDLMLERMGATE